MKTPRFLLIIIASGTLASRAGLATEPSANRAPHETHPAASHPASELHPGKGSMERSVPKSSQPGPLHTQIKPNPTKEALQHDVKRTPAIIHSGVTMNKPVSLHEALAKWPENKSQMLAEPKLNHSRSTPAPIMSGLTMPAAKYSTASLNGTTFRRKP
jgi:hypothetical protein